MAAEAAPRWGPPSAGAAPVFAVLEKMGMRIKAAGWVVAAIFSAAMCACGGGKQEAAMALDEARLTLSSARKSGVGSTAAAGLTAAATALADAEDSFAKREYAEAKASAHKARDAAMQVEKEIAARKTAARPKRRAGRK